MNGKLGKTKFNSLGILLYHRAISCIIPGKYMQTLRNKSTNPVRWITQGGDFNHNYTIKVEMFLPEIYATKIVTWNFHVDEYQGTYRYGMILVHDIFSELNIDL